MKKVILFALILAIALGGIVCTHAAVTDAQDELIFYPITQTGDEGVLSGLTAAMTFRCGDHLRWQTEYPFGGEARTEFVYTRKTVQPIDPSENRLDIFLSNGFSSSVSGGSFTLAGKPYSSLFQAVAQTVPAGGSKTADLELDQYMDFYSPEYELHYQDGQRYCDEQYSLYGDLVEESWHMDSGIYHHLMQLFRFPVQPEQTVSVTVGKNDAGQITELGLYLQTETKLQFCADMTEEGLWFIPVFQSEDGTPLPYEAPQGHGLYFAPWNTDGTVFTTTSGSRNGVTPNLDLLELKLALPQEDPVAHMVLNAEAGTLWMLTAGESTYDLLCYDLNTGALTAELPLFAVQDPDPYAHFVRDGDYLLVYAEEQLALVDAAAQTLLLTAPEGGGPSFTLSWYTPGRGSLHFDGEMLVLTDAMYYRDGAFWAAAWRQGEQLYYGEYDCSLMAGNDYWYYSHITLEKDPVTLK